MTNVYFKMRLILFQTVLGLFLCFLETNICFGIEKLTFLYIPGKRDSFYLAVEKGIRQKAEEFGIKVHVSDYPRSWEPNEQIRILNAAMANVQAALIIITPASEYALTEKLKKISEKGIPVITLDRHIEVRRQNQNDPTRFPLVHIGSDNEAGGKMMADRLAKLIRNEGRVYINSTFPDIPAISDRFKAFLKAIEEYPNISIVGIDIAGIDSRNTENGGVGTGKELQLNAGKQSLEMLQKHPEINAVYCTNIHSATGVVQTISDTGLSGAVRVITWGATLSIIQALDEGKIHLVLAQKPAEMGANAVFHGYQYLISKNLPPQNILLDFVLFTSENLTAPSLQQYVYE